MKKGYVRVSTEQQDLTKQITLLKPHCDVFFKEVTSSRKLLKERDKMLQSLQKGDYVYVTKLDRLGRSLKDLLRCMEMIQEKQAGFVVLSQTALNFEPLGKRNSFSSLTFNILAAVAEFERDLISERTKESLKAKGYVKRSFKSRASKINLTLLSQISKLKKKSLTYKQISQILQINYRRCWRYGQLNKKLF